ncbi:unnamed protein product [Absidia cylindrospora]
MDFLKHQNESTSTSWEELQEPVPFEDFKFSFGLDPDFSIPLPLDTTTSNNNHLPSADPMLSDEIFPSFDLYTQPLPPPLPSSSLSSLNNTNSVVLDEQDQKTFSNFLDTFFMDPPIFDTQHHPSSSSPSASSSSSNYFMPPLNGFQANDDDDMEEQRRNSILQSLDHQKQKLHDRLNYLATSATHSTTPSPPPRSRKRSCSINSTANSKKQKSEHYHHHKELLTEAEKRANHIASEQKRRSTIRTGFKDLTEIIPTLKNIHHSKSTVLFKAVDFIKHLDRRNKLKREKVRQLEMRLQMQQDRRTSTSRHSPPSPSSCSSSSSKKYRSMSPTTTTTTSSLTTPPNVTAALMAHKSQQAQLLQLQEQLQLHQRLLARQQSLHDAANTLPPLQEQPSLKKKHKSKAGFRAVMHDADDDPFFKPTLSA